MKWRSGLRDFIEALCYGLFVSLFVGGAMAAIALLVGPVLFGE